MRILSKQFFIIFFSILISNPCFLSAYSAISKAFNIFTDLHEGEMGFRSLLIHPGGRIAALNGAFTALANDITFFETNPAGSATLNQTELAFFHNAWIADSHLDTLSYSMRTGNLGYGASLRCFYIPFTEYGSYGEKLSSGYYSETFTSFNVAYNFFNGYKFKGLSIGSSLKFGIMSFPPFQGQINENEKTNSKIRRQNALGQMSFAVLLDFGIQFRGNFLKNFDSKEPNIFFGLAIKNLGPPIKGDIAPASVSAGFAYQPVKLFTLSLDFSYPINILNIKHSGKPFASLGFMFNITKYFNLLTGFGIRGGNPRFTLGGEVNLSTIQINANYTLDLTSQTTALNHVIVGIKIFLGDRGRGEVENKLEAMYIEGLHLYKEKKYQEAIKIWEEILKINRYFEPAKVGIKSAKNMHTLQTELLKLEQFEW
ncbi:MAG: UPF0164 family protein [Treponema sp.]